MKTMSDYPLSLFREAFFSVVGRVGSFVLASLLGSWIVGWVVAGSPIFDFPRLIVYWLVGILVGIFVHGWGFLSYSILAVLFVSQVHLEKPLRRTLPWVLLVQSGESARLLLWEDGPWPLRVKVFAALWVVAFLVLSFPWLSRLFRSRLMKPGERLMGVPELLDQPSQDPRELERCLKDLAWINRFLGGTRVIFRHLPRLVAGLPLPVRILDVATGYADIPRAVARWGRRRGLELEIEGVDGQGEIVELAARASSPYPEVRIVKADGLKLPYRDESFDVVLASLVLHHLEGEDPEHLLRELYRVARHAVLVNDLQRGHWPFLVTWGCLHLVSRNRLIRHDGPLSIRRGFLPAELKALAGKAGWPRAQVTRHRFFRLALCGEKDLAR